jgi:hypothetical protein
VFYRLVAAHSGKLAGIAGVSTAAGAALTQWSATGGLNLQFDFVSSGECYYRVRVRHSGLAMEVWGASTADGARLPMEPHRQRQPLIPTPTRSAGSPNNHWTIAPV